MKTLITISFVLFASVFTPAVATAAPSSSSVVKPPADGPFSFFRVHRQGPGISLSWSPSSSSAVQFIIERSYDGEFFDPIGGMNCSGTRTHKFSDIDVFPGTVHYRIVSVKANGTSEISAVETVRIMKRG